MISLQRLSVLLGAVKATRAQDPSGLQQGPEESLGVHGSGTTHTAKCFWQIMSNLEEQIKLPTRFTYRAVGTMTGIREFLGNNINADADNGSGDFGYVAYNDFGAGDIPIPKEDRDASFEKGIEFVQLPFALSAVSFFHNIPGVVSDLGLSGCLLARIFNGDITTWDDPNILNMNPGLKVPANYPIFVARRALGSSTTYSITKYLNAHCPQTESTPTGWPLNKVSGMIEWHPSTHECQGSTGMINCIRENEGAIGYMDSSRGHDEGGLTEVSIQNADGKFLTLREAGYAGVQQAAMDLSDFPDSADGDFSYVSLYNKPGINTWPITRPSYIYIRKDLSFINNPSRRTLLKAFASALFDPNYIGMCDRYGLVQVPNHIRNLSLAGLDMLQTDADVSEEWAFEDHTMPGVGQGDYVVSQKRGSFASFEASRLADEVQRLSVDLANLRHQQQLELSSMRSEMEAMKELIKQNAKNDNAEINSVSVTELLLGNDETTTAATKPMATTVPAATEMDGTGATGSSATNPNIIEPTSTATNIAPDPDNVSLTEPTVLAKENRGEPVPDYISSSAFFSEPMIGNIAANVCGFILAGLII